MDQRKTTFQLDAIKTLAIISVLVLHTIPGALLAQTFYFFHIWQAVPIFCILMGFNAANSFNNKNYLSLREMYSKTYFVKKFSRYGVPFIFIFLISFLIGAILGRNEFNILILFGQLPMPGPGNYFITWIFQFILIFPLLYKIFKLKPKLTLFLSIIIELIIPIEKNLIFGVISAIVLGMWFSDGHSLSEKRNRFILYLIPFSIIFLLFFQIGFINSLISPNLALRDNSIVYIYSSLLFLIGMKILPKNKKGKIRDIIKKIGKSSFHIFLIQILYFRVIHLFDFDILSIRYGIGKFLGVDNINLVSFSIIALIFNIAVCLITGIIFHELHEKLIDKLLSIIKIKKLNQNYKRSISVTPLIPNNYQE